MPDTGSTVGPPLPKIRRLAWMAIGLGLVSLVFVVIGAIEGGSFHWWVWALPCLVIANASVGLLRAFGKQKRFERWFPWLSIAVAVAIIVAQVLYFTRKFRV